MARKKKEENKKEKKAAAKESRESNNRSSTIAQEETIHGVFSVICFVLGVFFSIAAFSNAQGADSAGPVGGWLHTFFQYLFGIGYFLLPLFFFMLAVAYILNIKQRFSLSKIISSIFSLIAALGIIDLITSNGGLVGKGGVVGHLISEPMLYLFAFTASMVILIGLLIVSLLITFDTRLDTHIIALWKRLTSRRERTSEDEDGSDDTEDDVAKAIASQEELEIDEKEKEALQKERLAQAFQNEEKRKAAGKEIREKVPTVVKGDELTEELVIQPRQEPRRNLNYTPIPLSLLEEDSGKPGVGDIKANANIIKRTLQNFGIDVEMDEISIGPSVTRYALKPAEGVKLARIVALQNDLSLALAAHPIRIEAPIPGKSLVGIEIPNNIKTKVGLGTLLSSSEYQQSEKPLLVGLGKAISGKALFSNMAKMPHLLIAGATGSGKSVTIHAIILSLLYRNSPSNLKFIMIDPKRVELTLYNKIPHLLTPVITEAKKAILSLKWAAKEMDRRYDILESCSVRDIESYHKNILEPALKKQAAKGPAKEGEEIEMLPDQMPYIVIVIDELADIMQTYPRELEAAIVRLAQMSRAVGIHLMLSTQRPSVNVITGLIKANVPARIALQVASQIDSRTILDMAGAEKLLGAGDMLYLGGEMSKPQRLQSPFVSEKELKDVVKFLAETYQTEIPSDITLIAEKDKNSIFEATLDGDSLEDDDELYEEARQIVIEAGKASTSYIQRKLRVGYARAARLMDILEERGVIGPADGSKPRSVIGAEASAASPDDEVLL